VELPAYSQLNSIFEKNVQAMKNQRQSFTTGFLREIELAQQVDQLRAKLGQLEELKTTSEREAKQKAILEVQLK
jgi:hypothetical protein